MTQESIQPFLDWIGAHPHWSGFAVFLISLSESLAVVGLVVPGVVLMTAIGAMMGGGILPFWLTLTWAILGAIAGDGISYWLGHHYHQHLRDFWPFRQFPKLLARGEAFFKHHGGKSIIFGRFVGPVRPMIPVIAGMMDMTPKRFLFFNVLSAIAWAPLYSLPGILIGASLGTLSPEVAKRVGFLILLVLLILWLIYIVLLKIGGWLAGVIHDSLSRLWQSWITSNQLPWLRTILRKAEGIEEGQLGTACLFLLGVFIFTFTLIDVWNGIGLVRWNEPVYQVLRALYSDRWIDVFAIFTELANPWVLLPAAGAIGFWLSLKKQKTAALCWLITIGVGFLIGLFLKHTLGISRPEGLLAYSQENAFPSGHTLTATLVFGFASALIRDALPPTQRWIPWIISIPLILLIAFSRLYLGVHWFTDILGSLSLGTACVAIGTLVYRRLERNPIPISFILIPGILVLIVTMTTYSVFHYPETRLKLNRHWPTHSFEETNWWEGKNEIKELFRLGAFKRQATVLDVQWLGDITLAQTLLKQHGWTDIPKLNFNSAIMILANVPSPTEFPVMPKFHRDRLPKLIMAKPIDNQTRLVLQLWQSDYQTNTKTPLWVGTLRLEVASHPLPLMTVFLESSENPTIFKQLTDNLVNEHHLHFRIIHFPPRDTPILLIRTP